MEFSQIKVDCHQFSVPITLSNAPSIPKIKVKFFGGKPSENAKQWLFQFSLSFSSASDDTKKNALAQLLEDEDLTWYYQFYQSHTIPTQFCELRKFFLNRIRPQKSRLCQMTSLDVNAYITEFTTIASGATLNDPRTPIQMFINDVHEEICKYVVVVVAVAADVPEDGSRFMFITVNALPFIAL